MLAFGTLGPAGSNHDWVARRYLEFHSLERASVQLFVTFDAAFSALFAGDVSFVVQVAVHASVPDTVARYRGRAHLIDTFIAPSQPMAVLTQRAVKAPKSLGLQAATREYVDTSGWDTFVHEPTTVRVAEGLLGGKYDSGLTLSRYAALYPEQFRVDEEVGAVVDPWLVYATDAVCDDTMLAWPDSPARALYERYRQG